MTKIDSAYNLFFHPLRGGKRKATGKLLASIAIFIGTFGTAHLLVGCIKKYRVKHLNAPNAKTPLEELPNIRNDPNVVLPAEDFSGADTGIPNSLLAAIKSNCPLGPKSNPEGHALVWVASKELPASSHWILVRRNPIYTQKREWYEVGARNEAAGLNYQLPTQDEMRAYIAFQDVETLTFTDRKTDRPPWVVFCEDGKFFHARLGVLDVVPSRGMGLLLGVKR